MNSTNGSSSRSSSSSSSGCPESDDINVSVITAYNPDGKVVTITAVNPFGLLRLDGALAFVAEPRCLFSNWAVPKESSFAAIQSGVKPPHAKGYGTTLAESDIESPKAE